MGDSLQRDNSENLCLLSAFACWLTDEIETCAYKHANMCKWDVFDSMFLHVLVYTLQHCCVCTSRRSGICVSCITDVWVCKHC